MNDDAARARRLVEETAAKLEKGRAEGLVCSECGAEPGCNIDCARCSQLDDTTRDAEGSADRGTRFTAMARMSAHKELDRWFDEVERDRPDYAMGEQSSLAFNAGYAEGYMSLTCKRSIEREFGGEPS